MEIEIEPAPPLFVVGCGRSGTTLLRLMLNSHPELAIPPEAQFIDRLAARRSAYLREGGGFDTGACLSDLFADRRFEDWAIAEGGVRDRVPPGAGFGEILQAAFEAYAAAHGKRRWGDKTPDHVRSIPLLSGLWPDGRFVHLIRDGRDVAASLAETPFGPKTIVEQARYWGKRVRAGRKAAETLGDGHYLEVRYEALVSDPEAELRRICAFSDLEFDRAMLAHHEHSAGAIPHDEFGHQGGAAEPLRAGVRDWRTEMSPRAVAAFEATEGKLLDELGYPRAGGLAPGAWMKARASDAREAADIRRRVRRAMGRTKRPV